MIKIIPFNLRIYTVSCELDNYYLMNMYNTSNPNPNSYTRVVDFLLKSSKIHWIFPLWQKSTGFLDIQKSTWFLD